MYPIIRMMKAIIGSRGKRMDILDQITTTHRAWPWDIDPWKDLNNGRIITLFDLGRIALSEQTGLTKAMLRNRWGIVVAGNTTRYRKRITMLQRFEMRTRCLGWDARFFYMEQAMWRGEECCNHILIRGAITSKAGIVPPQQVVEDMGHKGMSPELPAWVQAWAAADQQRPWPPEMPR
ncbi:acyl-CoA thioesterase FadM [Rhodobacter aestuarii]|uniref:Acyl-CoA thioesterase FadM n=1 Tax=Rhodobacter aestuarii TaxID=453582 RepID=A0A1N7LNG6_9RHOB|nr:MULTISPECIES: acyl-CoA thioesterase [Rhodobacter]PTV95138.1 acyl-CoA thioesterase FadM [Rhodobacter aestuarii]SIS75366.1 Acyl-CoA thioesterase FadM [Rhodobacter aestuarii]SOC07488.1 acyl-CoA thioesterase FadM [Rhodobacter sp. JA431]